MLPFGQLPRASGSRAQVLSHWLHFFERKGCEVIREEGGRLSVLMPGWDDSILGDHGPVALQRWFRDRMTVTVRDDGAAYFRHHYFTPARLLFHAAICAIFALDARLGTVPSWRLFAVAHGLVLLLSLGERAIRSNWPTASL